MSWFVVNVAGVGPDLLLAISFVTVGTLVVIAGTVSLLAGVYFGSGVDATAGLVIVFDFVSTGAVACSTSFVVDGQLAVTSVDYGVARNPPRLPGIFSGLGQPPCMRIHTIPNNKFDPPE